MSDSGELYEKFKSLGVQLGARNLTPSPKPRQVQQLGIEAVVSGVDISTVYGQTFSVREEYPRDHVHGRVQICADCAVEVLAAWSGTSRINNPGQENIVFLDTETSGLAGGTGTFAFLVGIGYRTPAGFELVQFFMRDPSQESALLAALDQWLARFDVVVTFNGKSYDVPLLNTRYTLNGLKPPFGSYEHLDVLHIARKLWRDRLPSRALSELEKEIVQFYRTEEEVPGWMIPQLYFDYLRTGDARQLSGVFYHNARDILSLAALYNHIAGMLKDPLGDSVGYGLDLAAIARIYEEKGWLEEAAELYERSLDMGDLPEEFFFKYLERFALLRRKTGDWENAVSLWQKAAAHGQVNACIELSKYYEHRVRNYTEALAWARKALEILDDHRYYEGPRKAAERDLSHRIGRLYQRVYNAYSSLD